MTFNVGDKVTLKVSPDDPMKLRMSYWVSIAEVIGDGRSYTVWHEDEHVPGTEPIIYGPYPPERITPGWAW